MCDLFDAARTDGFTQEELNQMRSARLKGMLFLVETAIKRLDLEMAKEWIHFDRVENTAAMGSLTVEEVNDAFRDTLERSLITVIVGTWEDVASALQEGVEDSIHRISYGELL